MVLVVLSSWGELHDHECPEDQWHLSTSCSMIMIFAVNITQCFIIQYMLTLHINAVEITTNINTLQLINTTNWFINTNRRVHPQISNYFRFSEWISECKFRSFWPILTNKICIYRSINSSLAIKPVLILQLTNNSSIRVLWSEVSVDTSFLLYVILFTYLLRLGCCGDECKQK